MISAAGLHALGEEYSSKLCTHKEMSMSSSSGRKVYGARSLARQTKAPHKVGMLGNIRIRLAGHQLAQLEGTHHDRTGWGHFGQPRYATPEESGETFILVDGS